MAELVGMENIGASGPGEQVMKKFGFTAEHVAGEALRQLGRTDEADRIDPLWSILNLDQVLEFSE